MPAVLRVGVKKRSFDSLQAMSGSGITPELLRVGEEQGVPWVLLEWIDGTALDLVGRVDVDAFRSVTAELLTSVEGLYVHPAPDGAREAALAVARDLEVELLQTTQMPKSLPPLHTIPRDHWGAGVHLHGDLLPSNVIRTHSGRHRVYDLEGGFGPAEADIGWWISGQYIALEASTGDLNAVIDGLSNTLDDTTAAASWLNAKRLHAWTAYALCQAANALRRQGVEWARYRVSPTPEAGSTSEERGSSSPAQPATPRALADLAVATSSAADGDRVAETKHAHSR
jgi:hypothetical protein